VFDHGVASFDPLADRVLLWTMVPPGSGTVRWELATDEALGSVVAAGEASPGDAGTVTVDATGLEPGTTYWYRFAGPGGAVSPVGRTRTLPDGQVDRFRIAVTCCARYTQSHFDVYRHIAEADVDLVLHLGDYVYEDCKEGLADRPPEPTHDAVTLDDYRARYAQYRSDPDLAALHAAHPMAAIWDDHDFADNAWSGGAKSHDPDEHGPWAERRLAALTAQQEFVPKRLADPDDLASSWRRLAAGDLVAVVCMETRVAGRDEQAGLDGTASADDPDRSLLGDRQRAWLLDAVRDRSTRWVLVASGTVMSELEIDAPDLLDELLPEKYAVVDGRAVNTDQWDGYRAERAGLVRALHERAGGTVVVSGDIHSSWAIDGPLGPDDRPVAVELTCPPAATTPVGQLLPKGGGDVLEGVIDEALQRVRWVDLDHRGWLQVDLDHDEVTATWWWVERSDEGPAAERGRTWRAPHAWPPELVDPELPPRGRARQKAAAAVAAALAMSVMAAAAAILHHRHLARR
jgi:alkaline phosphatase D